MVLALAGVVIAVAGALLPAGWAAAHPHRLRPARRVTTSGPGGWTARTELDPGAKTPEPASEQE